MKVLTLALLCLVVSPLAAQSPTPKLSTVTDATVTTTWVVTNYAFSRPDANDHTKDSAVIRVTRSSVVGDQTISSVAQVAELTAADVVTLITDLEMRTRAAVLAGDPIAYEDATQAALYAWLQSHGYVDPAAQ